MKLGVYASLFDDNPSLHLEDCIPGTFAVPAVELEPGQDPLTAPLLGAGTEVAHTAEPRLDLPVEPDVRSRTPGSAAPFVPPPVRHVRERPVEQSPVADLLTSLTARQRPFEPRHGIGSRCGRFAGDLFRQQRLRLTTWLSATALFAAIQLLRWVGGIDVDNAWGTVDLHLAAGGAVGIIAAIVLVWSDRPTAARRRWGVVLGASVAVSIDALSRLVVDHGNAWPASVPMLAAGALVALGVARIVVLAAAMRHARFYLER